LTYSKDKKVHALDHHERRRDLRIHEGHHEEGPEGFARCQIRV